MAVAEINRDEVEALTERLLGKYGDVPVREEREEVPAEVFPELRTLAQEGYTGGSYVWVIREPTEAVPTAESIPNEAGESERVLMVLGRGTTRWGLPGGGRECGESYEEAAVREVHQETGIDCRLTEPFLLSRRVTASAGHHNELLYTLWVFFDGRYEGGHLDVPPGELNGVAWFAEPPARMQSENEFRAANWNP